MTYEEVKREHPAQAVIFELEEKLLAAERRHFFNFRDDTRPVFGGMDPDYSIIDFDHYNFLIEIDRRFPDEIAPGSVCLDAEHQGFLELLDMRAALARGSEKAEDGILYVRLTADRCMELIKKFFDEQ